MVKMVGKLKDKYSTPTLFCFLIGVLVFQNQACSLEQKEQGLSEDRKEQVVSDTINKVLLPQIELVQGEILSLEEQLFALKEQPDNLELWEEAREGWVSLMTEWQVVEAMQLASFSSSLNSELGLDIRDEIYSWPTVNPCRIDQETALSNWEGERFFEDNLVNVYGLDALEHLLFADLDTICPSQVSPVSDGLWDDLGEEGIRENRVFYAEVILENIAGQLEHQRANILTQDQQFTIEQRFQDRFTALFYLETMAKDRKLAHVLGEQDCSSDLCLEDVEGVLSDRSLVWLQSNVKGFRALFTAGDGIGFAQLLIDVGAGDVSSTILMQIDTIDPIVDRLIEEYDGSLVRAIVSDQESVRQIYDGLSVIADLLEADIASIFQLEIPTEVAGDND